MACKNCNTPRGTDFNYCPNCGAKVIRKRLSLKNLLYDVAERFFNLDNTFLKTFVYLFRRPEVVIGSYIEGVRRKFLNPMSYIGIALTTSGLFLFILRKYGINKIDFNTLGGGLDPEVGRKIMNASLDFSSFIFLLYLPVLALSGWMLFNRNRRYNITEYTIASLYTLAHFSISSFLVSISILFLAPNQYLTYSYVYILLMTTYSSYVVNRLDGSSIWRTVVFFFLFLLGFLAIGIFINLLLLISGVLSLSDFVPKQP